MLETEPGSSQQEQQVFLTAESSLQPLCVIFKVILFVLFIHMCVYLCVCTTGVRVSAEATEGVGSPGAEAAAGCKLPNVGAGN